MPRPSRRNLIGAAAATPLATSTTPNTSPSRHPIIASTRAWLSEHDAAEALGREMSALQRRLKTADSMLNRKAARIARMRAATKEGALAKIEMGLKIQDPLDCEDHAWTLIQTGFAQLRALL